MKHSLTALGRLFLLLVAAAAVVSVSARDARQQDEAASIIARIEARQVPNRQGFDGLTLQEVMQRLRVPGVSVAVIRDFAIHWTKCYGTADVATGRTVEANTAFQAASISKPVTAMAAMRLVQERRLDLDADVNTILEVVARTALGPHPRAPSDPPGTLQPHIRL